MKMKNLPAVSARCRSYRMHDAKPAPLEGNNLEAKPFLEPLDPTIHGKSGTGVAVVVSFACGRGDLSFPRPVFFT